VIRPAAIAPLTQLLLGANASLALIVALQLAFPSGPATVASGADTDAADLLPDFGTEDSSPPPLANFTQMLDRPLFYAERRMPAPPADEPAPPPTPLRLKLEGVALSGGARVAVLRNLSNNLLVQLEEGGTHEGWTLDSLTSTSASFSRGEQVTELLLDPSTDTRRR
jgi:hypothetical protein